ncbi:MAG: HAMP domain-containing histidine kinase [Phycisphaerae bacterium]|nr:HAMP domain-containing histidine kinase [Phycisphaerae bacterium]
MTTNLNHMRLQALEHDELIARLRWFIRLRWLFGSTVCLIGLLLRAWPVEAIQGWTLVVIGGAILAYNVVFALMERRAREATAPDRPPQTPLVAFAQIACDLIALTLVLNATGGVENPFFAYYLFHMVIATLLLPAREVFALASFAILLYSVLALTEMRGWLPHADVAALQGNHRHPQFVAVVLLAFASSLMIAVYLGTSIAATIRKREQEVIRLERELAVRASELEQANQALRDADVAKTQYFRKVSHDLKSPLAAQQSLLRVLLREVGELPAEQRNRIERAVVRGDELLNLLDDLLTLSRTRDVTRQPQREWIQPADRLQAVLDAQALAAAEKGLQWNVAIDEPVPSIHAEPGLLPMLAENLISNAIKYTPKGGRVTVALRGEGEALVLQVQDTGIGIAKEDQARIGEEFYRTRSARESGSPGTGLGLTIVCSMIKAMNGQFDLASEAGKGTTVTIRLPRSSGSEGTEPVAAA